MPKGPGKLSESKNSFFSVRPIRCPEICDSPMGIADSGSFTIESAIAGVITPAIFRHSEHERSATAPQNVRVRVVGNRSDWLILKMRAYHSLEYFPTNDMTFSMWYRPIRFGLIEN